MIDLDIHGNTKPLEASVQAAINRIRRQPIKITVDDKGATQPLGNMKRGADEFSKSMEAANARIIAFGASMAIINGVSDAFKGMVKNMVEVEKALADINVVMGLSAKNLDKFSDSLFKVAKETGAAFNIAAQAATEYARQGLAVEESLKRTKDALILTRLTGMDSANAVKSLTAAMNTYGSQIKDTTQLVSKFAAVDVQFAVSAEDFADAIARTGAAAKGAGVDINELIGFVTAAQQKTARGGKVIGNSLKTIFTRVGRTDTLNQLEGLGIAVRDLEGKTLGAKRILTDLANTFDKLSESQKAQIAQTVGGVFQINVLKAVLGDAARQNGILSTATQIAAGATDEAITKNEQLRATMSAMATETGLAIKQLSSQIGEIMLAPGMEKILNTVKSFAESASGILGDGESTGNKFATGFLKGLGNIITGPGLVVLTTVFVKLFAQAFKFTKDSLNSLVGITTQAQKQKAIQTSLVALFGQNAALSKEMLRTDISRAEKEKIILGLIQAQVAQARTLNEVSKQAASTLYRQGYGPSLSPRKNRAYGHIPNFSERQQAAEGGYAAGNIRAMDMPGQGSVIYNSAEQVKNFAGFKQPAIMPPQSSKAGKNYQKAFGQVHGFDPYAADGFIPNFSRSQKGDKVTPSRTINAVPYAAMLVPQYVGQKISGGGTGVVTSRDSRGVLSRELMQRHKNLTAEQAKAEIDSLKFAFKVAGVKASGIKDLAQDEYGGIQGILESKIVDTTVQYADMIAPKSLKGTPVNRSKIKNRLTDGQSGAKGALGSVYGSIFEAALNEKLQLKSTQDVAQGPIAGGDFDVINPSKELLSIFGNLPSKNDYKASTAKDNSQSMAAKIAKEFINNGKIVPGVVGYKNTDRLKRYNKALSEKAEGHIPNFANPLADAISRERQAGVPVSQIRVDSHPALVNKSNPVGLGVTNTKDEPNGLRDVFGAKGFVPNYAMPGMITDLFTGLKGDATVEDYNAQMEKSRAEMAKHDAEIKKLTEHKRRYSSISQSAYASERTKTEATRRAAAAENKLTAAKTARTQTETQLTQQSRQRRGAQVRGNAGMTAILGLPMAAAYLQQGGPGQTGAGAAMYGAGGALQGAASTGYMASMIAPFFGPAAPLVIAAGALYGAFDGWTSAMDENTKALTEKQKERITSQTQSSAQSISQIMQGSELVQTLSKANLGSAAKRLGLGEEATVRDALNKAAFGMTPLRAGEGKLKNISEEDLAEFSRLVKLRTLERGEKARSLFETGKAETTRKSQRATGLGGYKQVDIASDEMNTYTKVARELGYTDAQGQVVMPQTFRDSLVSEKTAARESFPELLDFILKNEDSEYLAYGEQKFSKEEYRKLMLGKQAVSSEGQKADILSEEARSRAVQTQGEKIYTDFVNAKQKELDGVIVEIDKARALREIKKRTFDAEMKIKNDALTRSNLYLVETELQKKFLSEKEVAQLKYNQALDEAADSLKSAQLGAQGELRQDITTLAMTDSDFRANLAKSLGTKGEKLSSSVQKKDITSAVYDIPIEDLIRAVDEYKSSLSDTAAADGQTQAVRALVEEYFEVNRQLTEDNGLKVKGIELEKQRNQILADRNRIIRENTDALQAYNQETEHRDKIRGFKSQQKDAEILASGEYQSREMVAQRAVDELPETVQNIRRGYTGQVKEQLGGLGLDQDLQGEYFMEGTSLSDLTSKQTQKELGGIDQRMSKNRDELHQAQAGSSKKEIEKAAELQEEFEQLKKTKETIIEKGEAHQKLISKTEKKIQDLTKEEREHVKAIEDGAKARLKALKDMQGPEALGKGFKRGIDKMNEQVKFMDYELGQKIPENLANGLADAMGAALDGTKKLDDALMDVAINFLQMIQQAFLQKAAYQIVGGIGGMFNNGGSVRNYSKGGSVPAYVSDGEYVMNRQAVNKYGGSFMHNLNNGGVPKYHGGGSVGDFFGKSNSPSVGDFFKNQAEVKPRSVADFFSSPAQARSSKNNSAAIRRAINGNMGDLMQRKDFSSKIGSSSNAGMMAMNPGSDVSAALNPQPKSGGGFFGNLATGIGDFTSGIFDALFTPIKAVGSFFGFPGFSNGGGVEKGSAIAENFGGGRGIDTGRLYQRKAMSGYFYNQSNNVGVAADRENMIGVLREEERARQEAEARRRAKKARRKSLLSAAVGAVVSMGVSAIAGGLFGGGQSAAEGLAAKGPEFMRAENLMSLPEAAFTESPLTGGAGNFAQQLDWSSSTTGMADAFQYHMQTPAVDKLGGNVYGGLSDSFSRGGMARRYSFGGGALAPSLNPTLAEVLDREEVQKKNAGGWISGKSGIDQIPAMLSDGEYVIKASSARRLGRPMLDQINAGKYNEGGAVGDDMELVSDNSESESSGGNVNNISITVNVEKGQAKEESRDQSSRDPADSSEDEKNSAELAERVRHQVVSVIIEEQRPGGLLANTKE